MTTPARSKNIGGIRHYPDLQGRWVPSVTAVLKVLDLSVDGLISWASNIGVEIGQAMHDADFADAKRAAHAKRRAKAELGDVVHQYLEDHCRGREGVVAAAESMHPEAAGYVNAGVKFLAEHVAEVLAVEVTMLGDGYAGSCDLVVRLVDGRVAVVDWKTGKPSRKHMLQLAAYARAGQWVDEVDGEWKVRGDWQRVEVGVAVYLHDDGTFDAPAIDGGDLALAFQTFEYAVDALEVVLTATSQMKDVTTFDLDLADGASTAPDAAQASVEPPPTDAPSAPPSTGEKRRDWVHRRVVAIEKAGHLAELLADWPAAKISEATTDDIDAMARRCSFIEQTHAMPLPDPDPTTDPLPADDPRVKAVQALAAELPADLLAVVREHMSAHSIPSLSSGRCTEAQVDSVRSVAQSMHIEATARIGIAREAAERVAKHTDLPTLLRLAGVEGTTLTEDEMEAVVALAAGIECGVLVVTVGVEGDDFAVGLEVETDELVRRFGGRKALLVVAKEQADRLGVKRPAKTDDVVADPVLVGATLGAA